MKSPVLGDDLKKLYPISFEGQSDTATFDNTLELLTMSGYSLAHAAMMMIPEAWEQHTTMDERRRAFRRHARHHQRAAAHGGGGRGRLPHLALAEENARRGGELEPDGHYQPWSAG